MPEDVRPLTLRGEREHAEIDRVPDECPICRSRVNPEIQHVVKVDIENTVGQIEVCLRCPNQNCQSIFIAYYKYDVGPGSNIFKLKESAPLEYRAKEFSEEINNLSPSFVDIYNQALMAESHGLDQLVGMGLRKALEFLLKDYIIHKNPDDEEEIRELFLWACINKYVDDHNVMECARRAIWVGNDEAHYTRRWENRDISDLKTLIRLTINWIESNILTENYVNEMKE